ncbi:MAG TPA: ABC transporter permease [Longimicrobiales bacterium]|nr:ABC transporter permease [Longimicrobiales bacterium]
MRIWRELVDGLRRLLRPRDAARDLADEVRHFMEEAEADLVAGGATREEARRAVRLRYGDDLHAREDVGGWGWDGAVDALLADVRTSLRGLRRDPGFTVVMVLTLGLGIGAATAIFSVVRPVLFEPLAYPQPERILAIETRGDDGALIQSTFGTFLELERRSRSLAALAVLKPWQPTLTGGEEPERLEGQSVSASYFDVLGVQPVLGAGFDAAADRPGGRLEVILSDALWRARFGADPGILGRTVRLDGDPYTVVGVMGPTFENATGPGARLWTPLRYDPAPVSFDTREWGHHLDMIGRVPAGVDPGAARSELVDIAGSPLPGFPRPSHAALTEGLSIRTLKDAVTADARPTLLAVLGAVCLLAVVTCVNVTLLLLARGGRRRSEFAMRSALGASRTRLLRYLLTESLVASAIGGLVGIGVAQLGLRLLVALGPAEPWAGGTPGLDAPAVAFALLLTAAVSVVFGLTPGLHRTTGRPQAIRDAGRSYARRSRGTRRVLVVTEVALATVLLVGTGLILQSTRRLFSVPLGFEPGGTVVLQVHGTGLERGDAVTHRFFDQALDAVQAVPGVVSADLTSQLPLGGEADVYGVTPVDRGASAGGPAYRYTVTPGYLETMGIAVRAGRALGEDDGADGPPVAVLSERLARRLFQDQDPIGRRVQVGAARPDPFTVVGVVGDVKQVSLAAEDTEAVYVTAAQWHWADRVRWLVVRTEVDPMDLVPTIRRAVWSVDGDQPVVRAQPLEAVVARSEGERRLVLVVLLAFALAAAALAVIGLYGVVSGMVTDRLPEMGLRAALGAPRERIVGLVVRQGMALTAMGLGVGLALSVLADGAVESMLYQVSGGDLPTRAGVAVLLAAAAAAACLLPAVRAARADPARTLKAE